MPTLKVVKVIMPLNLLEAFKKAVHARGGTCWGWLLGSKFPAEHRLKSWHIAETLYLPPAKTAQTLHDIPDGIKRPCEILGFTGADANYGGIAVAEQQFANQAALQCLREDVFTSVWDRKLTPEGCVTTFQLRATQLGTATSELSAVTSLEPVQLRWHRKNIRLCGEVFPRA